MAGETSWASVPSPAGRLLLPWVSSAIVFDLGDAVEITGSPLIIRPGELWDSGLDARRTTPPRVSRALQEAPFSAPLSLLGNPQAGTLWARLIIFKVMETAFLSSAFDNLCGGSGGTWSPL